MDLHTFFFIRKLTGACASTRWVVHDACTVRARAHVKKVRKFGRIAVQPMFKIAANELSHSEQVHFIVYHYFVL